MVKVSCKKKGEKKNIDGQSWLQKKKKIKKDHGNLQEENVNNGWLSYFEERYKEDLFVKTRENAMDLGVEGR